MPKGVKTKSMNLKGKRTFFVLCSDGLSDIFDDNKEIFSQCNTNLGGGKMVGKACSDVNKLIYNFVKGEIDDNYTSLVVLL